jgi:ribonuclease VapC
MFIDTSAVIAILAREPDAAHFAQKIAEASRPISAGHVLLEASMRLASILRVEPEAAKAAVLEAFGQAGVEFVPIDLAVAESAVSAFARFGRGRGGKAQLNFGDCLSYACAHVHGASLLFKGEDFVATDALRA